MATPSFSADIAEKIAAARSRAEFLGIDFDNFRGTAAEMTAAGLLPPPLPIETLSDMIRAHREPAYGYSHRSLSADSGMERQCSCGEWFPYGGEARHLAEKLWEQGVRIP